jgi:hypothetical protein
VRSAASRNRVTKARFNVITPHGSLDETISRTSALFPQIGRSFVQGSSARSILTGVLNRPAGGMCLPSQGSFDRAACEDRELDDAWGTPFEGNVCPTRLFFLRIRTIKLDYPATRLHSATQNQQRRSLGSREHGIGIAPARGHANRRINRSEKKIRGIGGAGRARERIRITRYGKLMAEVALPQENRQKPRVREKAGKHSRK